MADAPAGAQITAEGSPDGAGGGGAPTPVPVGRRPRPIFLVVGVVVAVALGVGLFTSLGSGGSGLRVGAGAPSFSLAALGGGGRVSAPTDGRPAVVVFFASWCTSCQKELPAVAAAYRRQQASAGPLHAVRILGIDALDPRGSGAAFAARSHVTFPVGFDPNGDVTNGRFGFSALPEVVFERADGTVTKIVYGPVTTSQLARGEEQLVGS